MRGSMVNIQCTTHENRRGKKIARKEKKPPDENIIMSASATQGGHNEVYSKAPPIRCAGEGN